MAPAEYAPFGSEQRRQLPDAGSGTQPGKPGSGTQPASYPESFARRAAALTCAGSAAELAVATPVLVTRTDTQGAPAALAPRTSAAGLSPTA